MNLVNHTLKYLAFALFGVISVWAVVFYVNMLDEVYDSLDDGLDNYQMLIIAKAKDDPSVLKRNHFAEGNYKIREISRETAKKLKGEHKDTLMYMPYEKDLEPVRMLTTSFQTGKKYYELKVISSMVEEDDLIEDLFFALVWLYVALIASILIVNNWVLRKIWQPFYALLSQLRDFRLGKHAQIQVADTNVREFKALNESVSMLVRHALDTYHSQKQFIENASHELQTPIAISINRLELLAEKNTMPETDLETIGQVIQTLERLARLNKSLLLLSKIENRQFGQTGLVSVHGLVTELKEEFSDFAAFKNVSINLSGDAGLQVRMQHDLAVVLISNLLKNAIVHNDAGGSVDIVVQPDSLRIANSGPAVALDPEKIFRRFEKGDGDHRNTGLGLAIVKAIADMYGFEVRYTFDGQHVMQLFFKNMAAS